MRFNVNDKIRVKLNDKGRELHRLNHQKLFAPHADQFSYTPPKEDNDGWSEWQMWQFMQEFGPHIAMGLSPPFETEIDIVIPDQR